MEGEMMKIKFMMVTVLAPLVIGLWAGSSYAAS